MEATELPLEGKKWYKSRTLWVNAIMLVALMAQVMNGFIIAPEEQGAIIIVVNLVLRAMTKEALV